MDGNVVRVVAVCTPNWTGSCVACFLTSTQVMVSVVRTHGVVPYQAACFILLVGHITYMLNIHSRMHVRCG